MFRCDKCYYEGGVPCPTHYPAPEPAVTVYDKIAAIAKTDRDTVKRILTVIPYTRLSRLDLFEINAAYETHKTVEIAEAKKSKFDVSDKPTGRDPYDGKGHERTCRWIVTRGLRGCTCKPVQVCDCEEIPGENKWVYVRDSSDGMMSEYRCRYCGKTAVE